MDGLIIDRLENHSMDKNIVKNKAVQEEIVKEANDLETEMLKDAVCKEELKSAYLKELK